MPAAPAEVPVLRHPLLHTAAAAATAGHCAHTGKCPRGSRRERGSPGPGSAARRSPLPLPPGPGRAAPSPVPASRAAAAQECWAPSLLVLLVWGPAPGNRCSAAHQVYPRRFVSPPERAVADAHRGTLLPDSTLKRLLHATLPQRNFNAAQKGPQSSAPRSQGHVLQLLLPSGLHCRSSEMGAQCPSIHPKGCARARTWAFHRPNPSCKLDAILFGPKISSWSGQVELHPRLSRNDWQWTEIQDFWVF